MSRLFRLRSLISLVALTAVWCGLWADLAPGTVVAGLAVAVAVTAMGVGTRGAGGVRLWPLLRLLGVVAADLARSTLNVAVEIITPVDSTDESIIAVDVPLSSRDHLLLLVIAITLTPGTAVVDADPDRNILYLHLLHDRLRDDTVAHVRQLARLAHDALPVPRQESAVL
ncbi:Na+/H+ antiporter subunit E [Candidatus Poriferisocius sp.]|uniref:Na+/H+ antiporter subunit E n=1 Tax=Candidatus Poriferisocius sp. TaxID=3101276 RepID=UPI003B5CA32D